nr:hypothetical protein [Candidatus Sigynarchaeota archaeon]
MGFLQKKAKDVPVTMPEIHKRSAVYLASQCECTPVVLGGRLLTVTFDRPVVGWNRGLAILVHEMVTRELVARVPWDHGLGCAIVVDGTLRVFGSIDWESRNSVATAALTLDFKLGPTEVVLEAVEGQTIFNTSVAPCPGGYVMAYEVREKGLVDFSIRFAKSKDLLHWEKVGTVFEPTTYAACPSIRYCGGWYYFIYLRHFKPRYISWIARTADFETFDVFHGNAKHPATTAFLSSRCCESWEGINNSDVDLVEHGGMTFIVYCDGDQQTWMNVRTAVYMGTMGQLFKEFWP